MQNSSQGLLFFLPASFCFSFAFGFSIFSSASVDTYQQSVSDRFYEITRRHVRLCLRKHNLTWSHHKEVSSIKHLEIVVTDPDSKKKNTYICEISIKDFAKSVLENQNGKLAAFANHATDFEIPYWLRRIVIQPFFKGSL